MENTAEQTETAPKADPTRDDLIAAAKAKLDLSNPGTELWLGEHPVTKDWWWYRPATKPEAKVYKKKLQEQSAKGDLGDNDIAFETLVYQTVLATCDGEGRDGLLRLLTRRPMLLSVMAGEVCEVSGFTGEAGQKKY